MPLLKVRIEPLGHLTVILEDLRRFPSLAQSVRISLPPSAYRSSLMRTHLVHHTEPNAEDDEDA